MTEKLPLLLGNWAGKSASYVFAEFNGTSWDEDAPSCDEQPEFKGCEILLASYGTPAYEGYAFVLFRRDEHLFEVNGSHCSCYDLPGNMFGGSLHGMLNGGRCGDSELRQCMEYAGSQGDINGVFLCELLAHFNEIERREIIELETRA